MSADSFLQTVKLVEIQYVPDKLISEIERQLRSKSNKDQSRLELFKELLGKDLTRWNDILTRRYKVYIIKY